MAQAKVFVSSTSQDLQPYRDAVRGLLTELGHKPVAFEEPDFLAHPSKSTYDSCLEEVSRSDLLIMMLDRRYGSKPSGSSKSATRLEYEAARASGIPTFVLVSRDALSEHRFYVRNGRNKHLRYDVDDPDLFDFIDEIRNAGFGNWTKDFSSVDEVKAWIKGQLSSLLQEYISRDKAEDLSAPVRTPGRTRRTSTTKKHSPRDVQLLKTFDRMSYSYKAVLFRIVWSNRSASNLIPVREVVEAFHRFYLEREHSGLVPELQGSEMQKPTDLDQSSVFRVLWNGPIQALRGKVIETEGTGLDAVIRISEKVLCADASVQRTLVTKADHALQEYFSKARTAVAMT